MLDLLLGAGVQMDYVWLRVLLAVLGTGAAAYYDVFNKKNVPNNLLYAFVIIALLVNLPGFELYSFLYTLGLGALVFLLGWIMYKQGQIGGADVFVAAALALLLPVPPGAPAAWMNSAAANAAAAAQAAPAAFTPGLAFTQLPFILSVIFISGIAFVLYALVVFTPRVLRALASGKAKLSTYRLAYAAVMLVMFSAFIWLASQLPLVTPAYLAILGLVFLASVFFITFRETVQESMVENVPLSKVEPEDVLYLEKIDSGLVKKFRISRLVNEAGLARYAKEKIPLKTWPVLAGLPPFLPFLLLGLLLALALGDVFRMAAGI